MEWIKNKQTIRVTSEEMTRFLFTLDDAVDAVLGALENAKGGEVFVPQINSYTLPTCIKALEQITSKKADTTIIGLRPGEKLHEDMLAETELPFTYQVPNINLLQIRPQYTNKTYQDWDKYNGPHFNSELWVKKDIEELVELINKGLKC
jgi:UDP-N-acetylglucosamine 4,6-dehydratase